MNFKLVFLLAAVCSMLPITTYMGSGENPNTTVHTEVFQVNDNGTMEQVDNVVREEDWLIELELKMEALLEEKEYIEVPMVSIYKSEDDPSRYVYFISMDGRELSTKYDEINELVKQCLETEQPDLPIDFENSRIVDIQGKSIKP